MCSRVKAKTSKEEDPGWGMKAQWKDTREAPQVRVRELPAQLGP